MTRYTVVWDPDVEVPFIGYWVAGDSQTRATLTEIANWVDANLAEDPDKIRTASFRSIGSYSGGARLKFTGECLGSLSNLPR
jgi:hypothetical protein